MTTTNIFDANNGKLVYTVPGTLASFSPDGRRLLTGFLQPKALNSAAVWDGKTGKQIAMLEGAHRGNLTAVAVSPDGKIGLTGDEEGWIRAWDLDTGVELLELPIK